MEEMIGELLFYPLLDAPYTVVIIVLLYARRRMKRK